VTDADLVLGYLNPEYFLGGSMRLLPAKAEEALAKLADPLRMTVVEVAAGIERIVNAQMADLIRKCTVERGFDPRDFILFAYGGAGPSHVAFYGSDVGAKRVYVLAESAAFSALGMLTSDLIHTAEISAPLMSPFDAEKVSTIVATFGRLKNEVQGQYRAEGVHNGNVHFVRSLFMKHEKQAHELQVQVADDKLEESSDERLREAFESKYSDTFGAVAAHAQARVEIASLRVEGVYSVPRPRIPAEQDQESSDPVEAFKGKRQSFLARGGGFVETDIYDGARLSAGHLIVGPAIVERLGDTVVVPAGFRASVDQYRNIVLTVC
jgi:N-methylhydantoinase A